MVACPSLRSRTSSPRATPRPRWRRSGRRSTRSSLERQLWLAVLRAQRDLGVDVPDGAIEAYEAVVDRASTSTSIDRRPRAGHPARREGAHRGVRRAGRPRADPQGHDQPRPDRERRAAAGPRSRSSSSGRKTLAVLARLARRAAEYDALVMAGRSHNVAAQATTLGKRFATAADELLVALDRLDELLARYPLRGIKGPVGTAQDMLDLLDGDAAKLAELERRVAAHLGFDQVLDQRRPGLPALARLRRGLRARPAGRRAVVAGHDDPADGRQRAGHRGLPAGSGRLVGDAAQDEHPLGERINGFTVRAARLRVDGRRAGRRPVERGRRLLLGRAPGRAARRVLRRRRAVRDLPDRARRVRRLPGRDRARARPLPAVPRHDQGADGRGPRRRRAARRRTRRSRSTRSRWRWRCARRAPSATTCSTGSPPTRGSGCPPTELDRLLAEPLSFTGAARAQVAAVVAAVDAACSPPTRRQPTTCPSRSSECCGICGHCGVIRRASWLVARLAGSPA